MRSYLHLICKCWSIYGCKTSLIFINKRQHQLATLDRKVSTAYDIYIFKKSLFLKQQQAFQENLQFGPIVSLSQTTLPQRNPILRAWSPNRSSSLQLNSILVPDDLTSFHLHLLVKPLPVAAALHAALAWAALGAGVEAAHAVRIQTVAQVLAVGEQPAFVVVHPDLSARGDSRHIPRLKHSTSASALLAASGVHLSWIFYFPLSLTAVTLAAFKADILQIKGCD